MKIEPDAFDKEVEYDTGIGTAHKVVVFVLCLFAFLHFYDWLTIPDALPYMQHCKNQFLSIVAALF